MNSDALAKVREHLRLIAVRPIHIGMDANTKTFPLNTLVNTPSFSRFHWACIEQNHTILSPAHGNGENQYMVTFIVKALTELAVMTDNQPLPENVEIPEDLLISKIDINFAIDYFSEIEPSNLDSEGTLIFIQYNLPYHFWPYWRELMQNLALRAQLPVPSLPSYTVPKAARPQPQIEANN